MRRIEQFLEEHAGDDPLHGYAAAVDALVAAGVLAPEPAERWKSEHARLSAAAMPYRGPYDARIEAAAIELLEELFAPVRGRGDDGWDPLVYQRYQEALSMLTAVGALSLDRARPWFERQQQTLQGSDAPREPEPPFAAGNLSAVIAGPPDRREGMRVASLELFGDCVIVRYHRLLPAEPADPVERRRLRDAAFELADDVGTVYRPASIPASIGCKPNEVRGWRQVLVGWQAFTPGAPLGARVLTLVWREQSFRLALDAA